VARGGRQRCPGCGKRTAYVGLRQVECSTPTCKHHPRPRPKSMIERLEDAWANLLPSEKARLTPLVNDWKSGLNDFQAQKDAEDRIKDILGWG